MQIGLVCRVPGGPQGLAQDLKRVARPLKTLVLPGLLAFVFGAAAVGKLTKMHSESGLDC